MPLREMSVEETAVHILSSSLLAVHKRKSVCFFIIAMRDLVTVQVTPHCETVNRADLTRPVLKTPALLVQIYHPH